MTVVAETANKMIQAGRRKRDHVVRISDRTGNRVNTVKQGCQVSTDPGDSVLPDFSRPCGTCYDNTDVKYCAADTILPEVGKSGFLLQDYLPLLGKA